MLPEVPEELARSAEKVFAAFNRGILTLDELENELLEAAQNFADTEYQRAHPKPAQDALFDRATWEAGFETTGESQAKTGAAYALALAAAYEHADGLVGRVFGSPQWRQAVEPVQALLTMAGVAGADAVESVAYTAWLAVWRGVLPPETRGAVRGAALGTRASLVDLLESDREGDAARVAEIVAASGRRGCVSPAVQVLRLRREEGRVVDASSLATVLDPKDLQARGEFGGLAHMAAELLSDGDYERAAAWSSLVEEGRLLHRPVDDNPETFRSYYDDRLTRDHGPGWCVPLCNDADARLLGVLAFVDWISRAGDRAYARAAACDSGADRAGWSAAGVKLLARWVLSRHMDSVERVNRLLAMRDAADGSHVELGLLGVQIHTELAELMVDDADAVAHHRARADWYRARPTMRLHFEPFQFPSLLSCLPLAS